MMGRSFSLALMAMMTTLALASSQANANQDNYSNEFYDRLGIDVVIFNRKRNAHACIMSIVFVVLYPLGAIATQLPVESIPFMRNTYLKNKIPAMHVPIQIIAFCMMIGGMGLGLSIGSDLHYLSNPIHAHVVIGLLVTSSLILFQPAMGILQHRHYKKTGGKSPFAYAHRWLGRGAIILGIINSGLGFQLASGNVQIPTASYIRSYVLVGVLLSVWIALRILNGYRKTASSEGMGKVEDGVSEKGDKPVAASS